MIALYFLGLIAIWALAGWASYRLWRRWQPAVLSRKILRITLGVLLFVLWFGGAFWEVAGKKLYWDAKVRELCAIDGGVRVYETVELPAEMFNRWGQPNFYRPNQGEDALGADYIFRTEIEKYRTTEPSISKLLFQVSRRVDNALLGESLTYVRSGGDLPGPWHGSTFRCPEDGGDVPLLVQIFHQIKEEGKK